MWSTSCRNFEGGVIDGYTSATIGPAIRTNVQGDKVKWRRRLIGVSDAFLALSMMLRWVQLKWKSGMAVASPRLFLALLVSLSPAVSVSLSCLSPRVFTHRPHRTLRPSSCVESISHTTYARVYTSTHTYVYTYTLARTHIHMQSASRVFARSVYRPSILPPPPLHRPVPSSLLSVLLMGSELPRTCVPIWK